MEAHPSPRRRLSEAVGTASPDIELASGKFFLTVLARSDNRRIGPALDRAAEDAPSGAHPVTIAYRQARNADESIVAMSLKTFSNLLVELEDAR